MGNRESIPCLVIRAERVYFLLAEDEFVDDPQHGSENERNLAGDPPETGKEKEWKIIKPKKRVKASPLVGKLDSGGNTPFQTF